MGTFSVEGLLRDNWRVARIPVDAFTKRGFTLDVLETEEHQRGHRNVLMTTDEARTYMEVWAAEAKLVEDAEYL